MLSVIVKYRNIYTMQILHTNLGSARVYLCKIYDVTTFGVGTPVQLGIT